MKLLILEDDPLQFQVLKRLLTHQQAEEHEISHADTLAKALNFLDGRHFDAILSDLNLPDSEGLHTVEQVRAAGPHFPLIVFTSNDDENAGVEALRKGAQDYVIKGQADSRLLKRILNYAIERKKLQNRVIESEKFETVARLSSGVAHHFNNLMAVIMGYGQIFLEHAKPTDPQFNGLNEICKSAQKAGELARHLLIFSKKEADGTDGVQDMQLNEQVESMRNLLSALVDDNIQLDINLAPHLELIHASPQHLEKLLTILVLNSRDAVKGHGKISVDTYAEKLRTEKKTRYSSIAPGNYTVLQVTDNGQGMSKQVKAHLFEPFFTTKEVGQGVGLGLATVYGLSKQLGASIDVVSEPGNGTIFKIYFPVSKSSN